MLPLRTLMVACVVLVAPLAQAADSAAPKERLPALSREWRGADYQLAVDLIAKGQEPLPRLSSKRGAALLRRLTAPENLSFNRNKTLPVGSRLQDAMLILQSTNALAKTYVQDGQVDASAHSELAALLAFLLQLAATGTDLLEEYLPLIPKDE